MPTSVFDEYNGYMTQRVAVVAGKLDSIDVCVDSAIGFMVEDGGTDPDALRALLLEAIRPADLMVDDKRSEFDWGASGPLLHELIITVSLGLTVSIAGAGLYDCLRSALHHLRRSDDAPIATVVANENVAWETFADFIEFAMKARRVRLEELQQRGDHWYVRAQTDRGSVEGVVTEQRLVAARIVREGQHPMEWPPPESDL